MLQKLAQRIVASYDRAADCRRRAEQAADPVVSAEFRDLEKSWAHLARSYEFVESLERFLLTGAKPQIEPHDDTTSPHNGRSA